MINLKDLPEDTKLISEDNEEMWDCKQSMLEDQRNRLDNDEGLYPVYIAELNEQLINRSYIEDLFVSAEENSGYEGQADDCMDALSEEDEKTVLDILNKAIKEHPAYGSGEEIDPESINQALEEI